MSCAKVLISMDGVSNIIVAETLPPTGSKIIAPIDSALLRVPTAHSAPSEFCITHVVFLAVRRICIRTPHGSG